MSFCMCCDLRGKMGRMRMYQLHVRSLLRTGCHSDRCSILWTTVSTILSASSLLLMGKAFRGTRVGDPAKPLGDHVSRIDSYQYELQVLDVHTSQLQAVKANVVQLRDYSTQVLSSLNPASWMYAQVAIPLLYQRLTIPFRDKAYFKSVVSNITEIGLGRNYLK
ncbi:uncharacterized protein BDW43DRAFT_81423 [Aspergillus alliaceus]|uniref:uncharacterized protein n=1 Tax=Petromyces alliaceus TaxID=209559 RepID=UPI0012A54E87|nr:uncharacterized protein BDW43DRAFT_81423 [Aspergillus alliaceus]KAB8233560.1 hypothetical protein BDW43DRAFT_81423 [Aspergillus alliaceus]